MKCFLVVGIIKLGISVRCCYKNEVSESHGMDGIPEWQKLSGMT